ncbi:MAG: hypothetical protein ACRDZQ_16795, partial [Acidimicrobiales bacterium]
MRPGGAGGRWGARDPPGHLAIHLRPGGAGHEGAGHHEGTGLDDDRGAGSDDDSGAGVDHDDSTGLDDDGRHRRGQAGRSRDDERGRQFRHLPGRRSSRGRHLP